MGDPTGPGYPSGGEIAFKLATGQAGDVVKEVGSKLFRDFTAAARRTAESVQRTLNATEAPAVPDATQATYKLVTGQAGDVVQDVAERALWETGQFVTNTAETVKRTLNQTTAPVVPTASQVAYKALTGQAGDVVGDLAKRGLWEAGQFTEQTVEAMKRTLNQTTAPVVPTASQVAYKALTGQAGDVVGDLAKRGLWEAGQFTEQTVEAMKRTLNQTTAPVVPTASQVAYKALTGQAGDVAGDIAERALWEAGQFVTQTADALKSKLNEPVAPALMDGKSAASKFVTGQSGEVVANVGGRALWEVGQFAERTIDSIYSTGAPATATTTAPADTAPPKTKAPPPPGSKP